MPITAQDLIRSEEDGYTGRLEVGFFPGYTVATLTTLVTAMIAKAYALPAITALSTDEEKDAAAEAWVYAEMYERAQSNALTRAGEIAVERVGRKKTDVKLLAQTLGEWAAEYRAAYNTAVGVTSGLSTQGSFSVGMNVFPAGG